MNNIKYTFVQITNWIKCRIKNGRATLLDRQILLVKADKTGIGIAVLHILKSLNKTYSQETYIFKVIEYNLLLHHK